MVGNVCYKIAKDEAVDKALEGFLHEIHHIIVTAVHYGRFEAINKVRRISLHEAIDKCVRLDTRRRTSASYRKSPSLRTTASMPKSDSGRTSSNAKDGSVNASMQEGG